jgi:hypothetical protein
MMMYKDLFDETPTPRLERERRLRLFQQMHQSLEWRRASGGVRCEYCSLLYREYLLSEEGPCDPYEGPIDHRLCGGDIVHL